MAFFRQLQLLLWKNWLRIIRQPLWSLTLIVWPLIIFIIIAVTRNQFPPVVKETCYVGPRNLPSTGFFPFLQTLMCNADSTCHNKSRLADPSATRSSRRSTRSASSDSSGDSLLQDLIKGDFRLDLPGDSSNDLAALMEVLNNMMGTSQQGRPGNVSFTNGSTSTSPRDQETLGQLLESVNVVKRAVCTLMLPMINTTSPNPISSTVVNFCKSNNTVVEVSLQTLNEILTQLMLTKPDEMATAAGFAMLVIDQLQNETALWDTLLAIPRLFSSGSVDQVLRSAEVLLTSIQGAIDVIKSNFPEAGGSLSTVRPVLVGGVSLLQYVQKWPGKAVSITLGDVVTLQNDSVSDMVKQILQNVEIPLDKAIALTLDKDMVRGHMCDNSSKPLWLTAACSTGTLDMVLGWISPDLVAKQALLAWSKDVAPHDLSFAKGILHSLMGAPSPGGPGGSNMTRTTRSVDTQPQNTEEDLFLHVGQVMLEVMKMVPEVDMVVQCVLRTGFQSMQSASLTLDTVEGMMTNVLKDADQLRETYLTLLTNQSEASAWTGRVLESVMEIIMKSLTSENFTCGDVLGPFEWVLNTSSVKIEVWRSMICENSTSLQDALVMDWMPVAEKVKEVYDTILVKANYSATPPMILSEWHKLYNKSLQFARLMERVSTELGEAYWMNWMPDNRTNDIAGTLQQSVFLSMVGFGNNIEKSPLWPVVKDYFHMAYWILNYRPGVTVQPANCSVNIANLAIQCETGLDWSVFVQAATQALMSPNQDVLLNCLKGSVNLLQHVYGDVFKNLAGSYLKQGIQGGGALSAYMINLVNNLNGIVLTLSRLPDQNISNPDVMLPLIGNLLQSTGLAPLLPLFTGEGPLNVSTVIGVASKLGRLNQHIFTFNETDPTMPELERLIMHFLSLEGNLTMSLSNIMGHSLLTYSDYFHPDDIARFREAIKPFTNQTSAGIVEAILSAMELLKKVMDSPNGDATNIILGYIRQLQEFVKSLYRLRKIQHVTLPSGELGANVSYLHGASNDFLNLLNPEMLMNLTQAGPDAAQDIVTEKFVAFLPPEVQQDAKRFLKDFKALQHHIATCAAGKNCMAGISEIFTFLDQILDLVLSADVNVTIKLAATNSVLVGRQYEELTSLFFSLLLPPNDAAYAKTFKQTLHFIRLLMARPNITVSDVQNALRQSNLTLEELDQIAALAGAANVNDLMMNLMAIINARQCFEPQNNPLMTAQCVQSLINGVGGFLTNIPALRNATAILSLIPVIANNTISDVLMVNFNSDPHVAVVHTLNSTLANVKKSLQMVHLNTPEIMTEIKVLEGLIQLAASPEPFSNLNTTLMTNPMHAQKVYLQIINFYLTRLANITSTSSVSELLDDFLSLTQMQVALQLAQTDFTLFVSNQVELLMNSLQYPIDGAGVTKIGETAVNILWRQFDLIKVNIEALNYGPTPICNTTMLNVAELQVKQYLGLIKKWMKQPNVPMIISSMLQWGNTSMNISTPVTDFQHLLQTMVNFLSGDQMAYLSIIGNITQSLSKALMVAEQPGGLQSEQFLDAIMEAVQSLMQNLVSEPPSHTLLQDIRGIVEDLIELIVQQDMSVASSRNISLNILKKAGPIIQQTVPEPVTPYFLAALKVGTTYFVTISEAVGPDTVNQLILNQMETVQSLLPPNSTVQAYISVFINITHFILDSGQGNMSLWATFQNASADDLPLIIGKFGQQLSGAIMEAVQSLMQILDLDPPSLMVQQDIKGIVDDLMKLIGQPDMSAPSSRNISLHILKRAERVIQQLVPEMFAEYLLPGITAATTYFETTSTVIGPDTVNQLILNQMETLKSLLPPNSTAQAYVSVFINITHDLLNSGQGNMSLWASFQNASAENLPLIAGKIGQQLSGTIMEAVQSLMQILDLDPPSLMVQQDIQGIVDDLMKLIGQPDMSAPSSRNISLHILKRAKRVIQQLVPQMFAEYLLPGLTAATTYFETTSTVIGPDTVNQLILNQMETLKSLLPPNSTAQAYISVFINITHNLLDSGQGNMSLWATFQNASAENLPLIIGKVGQHLSGTIMEAVQSVMQILDLDPPSLMVQQDIRGIVDDLMKLIGQPDMSAPSSRTISLHILKRAERVIRQLVPQMFAEYLLPGLRAATTYFETTSTVIGPDTVNQLILNQMETLKSLLPPNSTAQAYVSVFINITHFILDSGQGNMSLWATFQNASAENLPLIIGKVGQHLSGAIMEAVQSLMQILDLDPPSLMAQQDIRGIVDDLMKLIGQPDMSAPSSRTISLHILKRAERVIQQLVPQMFAEYLLPGLRAATTYFETTSTVIGPDTVNQLILNQMETLKSLLPPNSTAQAYVSVFINITHFILDSGQGNMSLWATFQNASAENLPLIIGKIGQHLSGAIMEAVQSLMQILDLDPPSLMVQQDIRGIVDDLMKLIGQPDMSAPSSRTISLHILKRAERVIQQLVPEKFAEYLLPGLRAATTYFEATSTVIGPDTVNQLILNQMETIQSLLPPNSTAQAYVSVFINITHFILDSGQGNMSLWATFEKASAEDLPVMFGKMGKLLSILWPLIMGGSGSHTTPPSLEGFAHLAPVLEQLMTGEADQDTWDKLEKMLEALLSTVRGTELWDSVAAVVPVFEKVIGSEVKNTRAMTELILSLQMPLASLMTEMAQAVNSSRFNLTEVSERMQQAIEHTLQAAEQANGTLTCGEVLRIWGPVREAAGLSQDAMAVWCSVSLQPLLEAYAASQSVYARMNTSHMGGGPVAANATAATIVRTVQSLYQASINRTLMMEQLVMGFFSQISELTGQPLSSEIQHHWLKQLQAMQLQYSLSSLRMLTDELLDTAPFLERYIKAVEKALSHILKNYDLSEDSSLPQKLFEEAAMIYLSSVNITLNNMLPMMWGNFSGLDETSVIGMMRDAVKLMTDMGILGDEAMVYEALEEFLASSDTSFVVQRAIQMIEWLGTTQASGLDLLTQALPKIFDILRPLLSLLSQMGADMGESMELFEELTGNTLAMLRQLVSTGGLLSPMDHLRKQEMIGGNHTMRSRHRREAPVMPMRNPMDDFVDLFYIDYPAMFRAISVPPTQAEILETAHVFFANPDLNVVIKGATGGMPWGMNTSREETVDAGLGMLSFLTLPTAVQTSSMDLLVNSADLLPDSFPFSSTIKKMTKAVAKESQENLILMQRTIGAVTELLKINLTDPRLTRQLGLLRTQVCTLEDTETVRLLMEALSLEPGQLCHIFLPSMQTLVESLAMNMTSLIDAVFVAVIGDPVAYNVQSTWTSVLTQDLNINANSLRSLNVNVTSPAAVTVGEMLRNKTAFLADVRRHTDFDLAALDRLMKTTLPNNNLVILSWLVNLRRCGSTESEDMNETDLAKMFCSMSPEQWYSFSLLMARHVNVEKLMYRMVLSEELQSFVGAMLQMAKVITSMMNKFLPAIGQLQGYLLSMSDLNLVADNEFSEMTRGQRSGISSRATFVTLSRALCRHGILALFGISKLPVASDSSPSVKEEQQREEMIERFKIPRNATPFCQNMYLDMVNTTGGAIAWAFLKPMLMGQILYTPDTPVTRAIMEKANTTLQEFANLRKHSEEWIESSDYVLNSAQLLSHSLPMLQNSLGNSFVRNFIEMQTDINVGKMRETLSSFSNMTEMLEKNKHVLRQITTLSTLMVELSSCITFDRYRGYDSTEQLDDTAQELAKNRDLYASVIFKLPKGDDDYGSSSRKRQARSSSSSASSLPPKVSYTIRMHMDNVMRTDRVRNPYFVKDNHISSSMTMRYNRGFVYLQESIDRAIIETQTGQRVTEPAVQLQPFPYPCHLRDEYLEAISFVFPLMLMMAWVLFVADFVKKLVHERELRLHEYMKMMGVNPLSHFFAWFFECATYLTLTIVILTLIMKHGGILPHSDSFLLFLYLCDYGLSILAFSYLVSSFFDKTYIAGLSGSLIYILCFFPFIVVMAVETKLTFSQKSLLGLFSPTCFSYASQYVSRYEAQGEGIHWSNSYSSPISGDTASFGWLCWLMLIDSLLYFIFGAYIRKVFPGNYGIPAPWYFPFKASFWADMCCCVKSNFKAGRGLLFTNIMQNNQPVFSDDKGKGQSALSSQVGENFSKLPVGVSLHGLSKMYGDRVAIQNLNVSFYEGHVTSLLGHNGAGKTTTMSLLTGLYAPSSGAIEVYGRDMQTNIDDVRRELGVCMQYDVLFDHMTAKEHLLLYGQIKAPQWSRRELSEQIRTILEETGMYAHRHKRVGTLSGGMKRKLSISIAFIGGSRLVVLDEPTTGVDPCSRRSIWDIVIQHKKNRTIIMSTHHLDEAEVLSDRIAFLERGGLKCCGSPLHLKDKLGQGYKLTLTKKMLSPETEPIDNTELKSFIQAHVPEARLKEAQGGDLVYSLPPFGSSNASSYRSLLTALDSNLDALQLGGYGISDTTLEEVFLQLTHGSAEARPEDDLPTISETVSDTSSIDSFPSDHGDSVSNFGDNIKLTGSTMVRGLALAWQQMTAMLIKRFQHSRRDWKGLLAQILLPVVFVVFAMGLGSIKKDLQHYPELELSPELYKFGPSYSFFSNQNPTSSQLMDAMMSFPGIDNACLDKSDDPVCTRSASKWSSSGNSSRAFSVCKCTQQEQVCQGDTFQPPHKKIPSAQIVYNLSGLNVENYLVGTANKFIRNRYGGFDFGMPLPPDLQMDILPVPKNRTLSKVWYNPEGHHTMPAYLNSMSNLILRSKLPADKDPHKYAISVSSHPYFGRADDEDVIVQGMLQLLVAICVMTGYSITTASFAIYEVSEHHSGSKRLQHIAGISEPFYWAVNFFYDMVMYLIPVTLTVGVFAAFQIPAFTDRENLGAITLLLLLFGFATFPWMYLLSGIFKNAEMAFISYMCINLFISVNTILSTSVLFFLGQIAMRDSQVIQDIFKKLCYAFHIFPQFNFGNGLMQLARMNIEVQILSGYGIDAYVDPFSVDALGWMMISSFIQGLVFFTLRLLLNKSLLRKVRHLICGRKTAPQVSPEDQDEDVAAEHLRVSSGAASSDILQVNQLTKIYQQFKKKVHAVKRISVGIPAGECFGLLGVNGAGKTTTFKMLTGDVSPTDGTAQIRDWDGRLVDIMECRNQGINIGYCPQVDALDNLLTGEEHLYFYGRIRGISKRELDGVVKYLLKRLELRYHSNIITDGYSCGTRRKLSTALALIGHPQILLLDEPSSGMDPRTKRHLWKIISEEVKGKCAVVLTSHSMEECEALCSRLAIMVKGQFCCLGSLQHIKNRFGSGFTVKMYLAEASCDTEAITGFMQRRFPSTYLKDQHSTMVEYHVPVAPGGVADIFDQLESNKSALQIKHFSVSQTTLDEVFINFAMGKIGTEDRPGLSDDDGDDPGSVKAVGT